MAKLQAQKQIEAIVPETVKQEIEKAKTLEKNEAMRFRVAPGFNERMNPDLKPEADIPFSYLRRIAQIYPVARACINRRIRQITQLDWDITTIDEVENEDGYKSQIMQIKSFFKQPMGHKSRTRKMLTTMVDDLLTVDAICFEKTRLRGGQFDIKRGLIPVDPTTIALLVTETGGTPEPPEPAYKQIISGEVIGQFSTDEMIYDSMGARSFSPYGLAPLESLIIQAESALRGAIYNLNYFKESNVPEGFITLPEDVASSKEQVEQWQLWFDSLLAGDPRFTRRLKILPGDSTYTAAKKPEDMAFERFELWLLQITCAVFEVQPQDIGITYQVNKSTGESQQDISKEKGLLPLANFIKEIMDDLIQSDLEMPNLQWMWKNINPVDRKEEVEIADKEIRVGAKSIDEYRIAQGLEPLGIGNFILTSSGPIMIEDVVSGKYQKDKEMALNAKNNPQDPNQKEDPEDDTAEDPEDQDSQKMMRDDLRKWKRCVYKDLDEQRAFRAFKSAYIPDDTYRIISGALEEVHSKSAAKILFDQFLDPEYSTSVKLLKMAEKMRRIERAELQG